MSGIIYERHYYFGPSVLALEFYFRATGLKNGFLSTEK